MAKGSVRKLGKKWYYRFYVEDASGRLIQKEYVGTESKSETEKLLRQAMEDYEAKRFIADAKNLDLAALLDIWAEEELKTGSLSNGTAKTYLFCIKRLKLHPISKRKLKTITAEHLQSFLDLVAFGGKEGDFDAGNGYGRSYLWIFSAILKHVFRFAVFPKKYIAYNPMEYVVIHTKKDNSDLFVSETDIDESTTPITPEMFKMLVAYLSEHHPDAVLPVQISYYTGLRLGEVSGLTWQDINFEEQYLIVRRSVSRNTIRHKTEIGTTKRAKVRTVYFGENLKKILWEAKKQQALIQKAYGELCQRNYYIEVREKNRIYFECYSFDGTQEISGEYKPLDLVCRCRDGRLLTPKSIEQACKYVAKNVPMFEGFHFHVLRHTFTTNLLKNGVSPKDVQEMLGHNRLSTTINTYAHGSCESKKSSAKLLDWLAG